AAQTKTLGVSGTLQHPLPRSPRPTAHYVNYRHVPDEKSHLLCIGDWVLEWSSAEGSYVLVARCSVRVYLDNLESRNGAVKYRLRQKMPGTTKTQALPGRARIITPFVPDLNPPARLTTGEVLKPPKLTNHTRTSAVPQVNHLPRGVMVGGNDISAEVHKHFRVGPGRRGRRGRVTSQGKAGAD
ncbi:hypothetical protein Bbelb_402020, partial [Branchiostoma belcheri]